MSIKALKKQLLAAVAMIIVAAIALSSSTFAWFAMNNTVTATNMQVTATATGSLVIDNVNLPSSTTGTITVASGDASAHVLHASTHDQDFTTYANGLKYVNNPTEVSVTTGLQEAGKNALAFSSAVNVADPAKYFYQDYTVWIAANGAPLTAQDLTVTLTNAAVNTLPGATSIDFYYATVNSAVAPTVGTSTYLGALNLAQLDPVTNDASTARTSLVISNIDIPQANNTSAIAVLMRVYVDGALKDSASTTYIKNIDVAEIANQTLGVQFVTSDHPVAP